MLRRAPRHGVDLAVEKLVLDVAGGLEREVLDVRVVEAMSQGSHGEGVWHRPGGQETLEHSRCSPYLRYSRARAATGSSLAARRAGKNPKTIPIIELTPRARTSEPVSSVIDQPSAAESPRIAP